MSNPFAQNKGNSSNIFGGGSSSAKSNPFGGTSNNTSSNPFGKSSNSKLYIHLFYINFGSLLFADLNRSHKNSKTSIKHN